MKKERNKDLAFVFYWIIISFLWFLIAFLKWKTEGITWIVVANIVVGILSSINSIVRFISYSKRKKH